MQVAVGHTEAIDTDDIVADLVEQCESELGGTRPDAGILFLCPDASHDEVLAALEAHWPGIAVIGCTTDGEISSKLLFREDSAALMVFSHPGGEIRAGVGLGATKDPQGAARRAVTQALKGTTRPPRLVVTLPESLGVDGTQVVRSLQENLPAGTPIVGATAGDQLRLERTLQFFGCDVLTGAVPILIFTGELQVSVGIASGWRPIGPRGVVTRAEGPIVHEIDGRPALSVFREQYGPTSTPDPEQPFAIFEEGSSSFYLRAPLGSDEETGAVTLAAAIPEGCTVQLSVAEGDSVIEAAREAIGNALAGMTGEIRSALMFSCAARKQLLGTRTAREIETFRTPLGDQVPVVGFYGYGEIGPPGRNAPVDFHNETVIAVLIGD